MIRSADRASEHFNKLHLKWRPPKTLLYILLVTLKSDIKSKEPRSRHSHAFESVEIVPMFDPAPRLDTLQSIVRAP